MRLAIPFNRPRSLLLALSLLGAAACGSSSDSDAGVVATDATSAESSSTEPMLSTVDTSASMRGLRYCEVLLLSMGDQGLQAEVYNTYPLNDCPDEIWTGLDGAAIAATESVPFALINGPRFWLMDSVERLDDGSVITKTFTGTSGDIDMNRYAVVTLGTPDTIGQAYVPQSVDRKSRFTFRAGSTIFVLADPSGSRFVMQSWSQQRDQALVEADLAALGSRLDLPDGWTFATETLTQDLVVDSTSVPAQVFQDELMNSYSLLPG